MGRLSTDDRSFMHRCDFSEMRFLNLISSAALCMYFEQAERNENISHPWVSVFLGQVPNLLKVTTLYTSPQNISSFIDK